jgi:L-ribulose-5-phosphate 3-epimerase
MTYRIGFMQGRLCDCVNGKIQAFPWRDWVNEFPTAASINIHLMEWTLDEDHLHENPLMTTDGQKRIQTLCRQYRIGIKSLTGDCFMQAPFWKADGRERMDLQADFVAVARACSSVGITRVVLPLVDNGRLENAEQENVLVDFLLSQQRLLNQLGLQVMVESDFTPTEVARFISRLPDNLFGINYDIGNSAALGYDPAQEFAEYGEKVGNVHVKDRVRGGSTVPLETGSADFDAVFAALAAHGYQGNFILQTARADSGNHVDVLQDYLHMTECWMEKHGLVSAL